MQKTSKTIKVVVLFYFSKPEDKTLLLKAQHKSNRGHGLGLAWRPLPGGLVFIVSEDSMQTAKREKQSKSYPAVMPTDHNNSQDQKIYPRGTPVQSTRLKQQIHGLETDPEGTD